MSGLVGQLHGGDDGMCACFKARGGWQPVSNERAKELLRQNIINGIDVCSRAPTTYNGMLCDQSTIARNIGVRYPLTRITELYYAVVIDLKNGGAAAEAACGFGVGHVTHTHTHTHTHTQTDQLVSHAGAETMFIAPRLWIRSREG
jgi:hypothetical protein